MTVIGKSEIEELLLRDNKPITARWLVNENGFKQEDAADLLAQVHSASNEKCNATFLLTGFTTSPPLKDVYSIKLVNENDLDENLEKFSVLSSKSIWAIHKAHLKADLIELACLDYHDSSVKNDLRFKDPSIRIVREAPKESKETVPIPQKQETEQKIIKKEETKKPKQLDKPIEEKRSEEEKKKFSEELPDFTDSEGEEISTKKPKKIKSTKTEPQNAGAIKTFVSTEAPSNSELPAAKKGRRIVKKQIEKTFMKDGYLHTEMVTELVSESEPECTISPKKPTEAVSKGPVKQTSLFNFFKKQ